jgi:hypothetical protein
MLGNRFVLTNPSFFTALEENDILLTIGEISNFKEMEAKA